jgi:hypothetical protein
MTDPRGAADRVASDRLRADDAAAALAMSMWPRFAGYASGGWSRQQPGVSAYCSGAPVWIFNGVIAAAVRADPSRVAELLDEP